MKIDFETVLRNLDDKEMTDEENSPVKLVNVCTNALMVIEKDDDGEKKLEKYGLAIKIKNGEANLKAEEVALLKKVVGKYFGPLIVGRAYEILDA